MTRLISDAMIKHTVESIKNAYNNEGVDAARQLYLESKIILDRNHATLDLEKLNRDLEDYYRNIIIKNGGKRKSRRKWSTTYKNRINCKRPKGFSQKQYCKYGKTNKKQ